METTVTFSFNSARYEGAKATETFTFEELGINGDKNGKILEQELEKVFQAWVWNKLNISYSIVMECPDSEL